MDKNTRNHSIIVAAVIISYYKVRRLHTWELSLSYSKFQPGKFQMGTIKKKGAHRGPQHFGSHQFLIMECWGRGVKRPHWAEQGKAMLGVAGREAARCFPPSGHTHEPWGRGGQCRQAGGRSHC